MINDTHKAELRKLAADIRYIVGNEWERRTVLGKCLYPLWFVISSAQWAVAIVFVAILWVAKHMLMRLSEPAIQKPRIYKNGENE